jgi:hypothetical protein
MANGEWRKEEPALRVKLTKVVLGFALFPSAIRHPPFAICVMLPN